MLRPELSDMTTLADRLIAAGETGVVATLFASRGSTYRALGSMMVAGPGPIRAGGVSGGCLEEYVARHGRTLVREHGAALMSFDTTPDGDADGRPVLGCGGAIEVLVERLDPAHAAFLHRLRAAAGTDAPRTVACLVTAAATGADPRVRVERAWDAPAERDPALGQLRARAAATRASLHARLTRDGRRRALIHYVPPVTRLVVFGAGDDVRPLSALARSLGWHVTVADRRARLATAARFPDADRVIAAADWAAVARAIDVTPRTAVVLMTHSLGDDVEVVPLLADAPAAYVGVLGPGHRRRWLLDGVAERVALNQAFAARIRGPVGLNLGDRSAPGIAVSIVADILAELNRRDGMPLYKDCPPTAVRPSAEAWAARG